MRPRFRSRSGPNAPRDGRPLELVRVRGPQRDSGAEGRRVERGGRSRRRRGGRGPRPPAPTPPRFSLIGWLKGLFGGARPAPATRSRTGRPDLSDQESRALAEFARTYGITFHDPGLLKLALTHRSYLHVTGQGPRESNERLEFLGDSVLGLVTSEFLYRSHPGEHEGQLTKTKSLLVSKAILSRRALAMGLGRFVLMSHAEVESGGRQRLSILADAFESVIGAVYLDQGFEAARGFIDRWLLRESKVIAADRRHTNYKSHLQEYVQSTFRTHPVYRIRSEMGPDHSKQFMVEVMVGRRVLGEGRGRNKKEAEQAAARNALEAVESGPVSDREKRRVERVAPEAGRAAPEAGRGAAPARTVEADDEESDESDGEERGRRRRRGRRGGRGRRERESGAVAASEPATGAPPRAAAPSERSAQRPSERSVERSSERSSERSGERSSERSGERSGERSSERSGERSGERSEPPAARTAVPLRPERPARLTPPPPPPVVPRAIEIEPMPPAREEDENEEVGRPEGPHEERQVDPYAWGTRSRPQPAEPEPSATTPPPMPTSIAPPVGREPIERSAATTPTRERPAARREEPTAPTPVHSAIEPEPVPPAEIEPETRVEPDEEPWIPAAPAEPSAEEEPGETDSGPRYPEVESPPPPPPAAPTWGRRNRRGR